MAGRGAAEAAGGREGVVRGREEEAGTVAKAAMAGVVVVVKGAAPMAVKVGAEG